MQFKTRSNHEDSGNKCSRCANIFECPFRTFSYEYRVRTCLKIKFIPDDEFVRYSLNEPGLVVPEDPEIWVHRLYEFTVAHAQ